MNSLLNDVRYAVRMCLRTPAFTVIAVLALALGIGANTAIFTIANAVLIEPLPFHDADRVVAVWEINPTHGGRSNTIGPANYLRWRERADAFEELSATFDSAVNVTGGGTPEQLVAQYVTPDFFAALGASPLLGRTFTPDEGPRGKSDVVVLGYGLWQRRFGGDPGIIGRTIQLNDRPRVVVGVMPPGVQLFLKTGSLTSKPAELWLPFAFTADDREPHGRYLSAIARLKPGVSLDRARAQMSAIAASLETELPTFDAGWSVRLVPLRQELSGEIRPALVVLSGAVLFVLLIACANVANLLLARTAARDREIAIRVALGAGRRRVMRQLLTESIVLAVAGGAAGLLLAQWALDFLVAIAPVDIRGLGHLQVSYPVLAFTAAISMLTAIVAGFAPALESARADVQESLKDGARQVGAALRRRRLRHAFVIAEVALAVVLLIGAGLLIRSFAAMRAVDPGIDTHHVLTMRVVVPMAKFEEATPRLRYFRSLVDSVARVPGVESAGEISFLPFAGLGAATDVWNEGESIPTPDKAKVVDVRVCDNGYFRTMHVPLLAGRFFTDREEREPSDVVIVNDTFARRYLPGVDPLGKRVFIDMFDPVKPTRIVGIVGDVRQHDLISPVRPTSYWPHPILAYSAMTLTVRTVGDPLALAPAVTAAVQAIDKDQPVADVRSMDQWIAASLAQARFASLLLAVFAGVALLLASIGVYGVMSYAVSLRTSEIGIRVALGAEQRDILWLIVGSGARLAVAGLAIGVVLALAVSRTLTAQLFEVSGSDPLTFTTVIVVLGSVAILASYLPARRAANIAPVEALRSQ